MFAEVDQQGQQKLDYLLTVARITPDFLKESTVDPFNYRLMNIYIPEGDFHNDLTYGHSLFDAELLHRFHFRVQVAIHRTGCCVTFHHVDDEDEDVCPMLRFVNWTDRNGIQELLFEAAGFIHNPTFCDLCGKVCKVFAENGQTCEDCAASVGRPCILCKRKLGDISKDPVHIACKRRKHTEHCPCHKKIKGPKDLN